MPNVHSGGKKTLLATKFKTGQLRQQRKRVPHQDPTKRLNLAPLFLDLLPQICEPKQKNHARIKRDCAVLGAWLRGDLLPLASREAGHQPRRSCKSRPAPHWLTPKKAFSHFHLWQEESQVSRESRRRGRKKREEQ